MRRVEVLERMAELAPLASIEVPSLRGKVGEAEWKLRVELAAAYRLIAHFGWDDVIFTHLSARIPGPDHHFLLNPFNLMFEEITASNLIKVNTDGEPLMETPFVTNPAGFVIHSAIHMAREDAHVVMHLHTPPGQAVSAHAEGLLPLTQTAMAVCGDMAFHDFEGIAVDANERARLVEDLGGKGVMLLRNHGTLAVGATIAEAFLRIYLLERACQAQVYALSAGAAVSRPRQGVPEVAAEQSKAGIKSVAGPLFWPALLRKAYRLDPSFAS